MRSLVIILLACVAASAAQSGRIMGGYLTTINQYPEVVSLLWSASNSGHRQACVGVIINNRSVLTAGSCTIGSGNARWRSRTGSSFANSGGRIYNTNNIVVYPQYNSFTRDHDISIVRTSSNIQLSNTVRVAYIAGPNYNILDNQVVWTAGWGNTIPAGSPSEQLRHVQIWTVNQVICRQRYAEIGRVLTDNMLCAGWLDVGGRDACFGDEGAPLYHNGVVVGVRSFGQSCGLPRFPGVSTRISRYTLWINNNR